MAKPPRPIPLPLLAKINALIVDLAVLADAIEADRTRHPRSDRCGIGEKDQAAPGEMLSAAHHVGEGDNVIPFPLRHPRR